MKQVLTILVLLTFSLAACATEVTEAPASPATIAQVELTSLETLSMGHYEGWLIFGEEKVSTGKFTDPAAATVETDRNAREADFFAVTIEPEGDVDDIPSGIIVLHGDLVGGEADLAFPTDLSSSAGSYVLATPTDGADTNERSGVWFLQLPPPPTASLELAELDDGWVYEGWAVIDGTPVSTGRFSSTDMADDFAGFSGPQDAPPFPGEDFLENAPEGLTFPTDLSGGVVVISVEPDVDGVDPTGPGPFSLKPLLGEVPEDAADHSNYDLETHFESLPGGIFRFA